MRVMIVEDELMIAAILCDVLEGAGHQVAGPMTSVSDAVECAETTRPDVVLVNVSLKDGGSGVDLARQLRRRWNIPSVFISGDRSEARAAGDAAIGYLPKPWRPSALLQCIEVVRTVGGGGEPTVIPLGLELYRGGG